jgi:hypothetical protein
MILLRSSRGIDTSFTSMRAHYVKNAGILDLYRKASATIAFPNIMNVQILGLDSRLERYYSVSSLERRSRIW